MTLDCTDIGAICISVRNHRQSLLKPLAMRETVTVHSHVYLKLPWLFIQKKAPG